MNQMVELKEQELFEVEGGHNHLTAEASINIGGVFGNIQSFNSATAHSEGTSCATSISIVNISSFGAYFCTSASVY